MRERVSVCSLRQEKEAGLHGSRLADLNYLGD